MCAKARAALLNWMYRLKNDRLRKVVTKVNWFVYDCFQPLTFPLDVFGKKGEMHYDLGKGTPYHDMRFSEVFGVYMTLPSEEQIKKDVHSKDFLQFNQ